MTQPQNDAEVSAFIATLDRLAGFDERIGAEWADGYLTALAAGPRAVAIDEWLPVMCGDAFERCFADPTDAATARAALATHARLLAHQLDPERLLNAPDAMRLSPLIDIWDEQGRAEAVADGAVTAEAQRELVSGGEWSRGFFDALSDFRADWAPAMTVAPLAELEDMVAQVGILGWPDDSPEMARHLDGFKDVNDVSDEDRPGRDALIDIACAAVQDLRVWWLDHGAKPATVHAQPKPGRNQPCFCGSGKKYKKCHGG